MIRLASALPLLGSLAVVSALGGCVFPDDFQVEIDTSTAACPLEAGTLCEGECVDLLTDAEHCGTCGVVCGESSVCRNGLCACTGGLERCGDACIDVSTNAEHCSACGSACEAGLACRDGMCTCEGFDTCGDVCTDLDVDDANCGTCGTECEPDSSCEVGLCWNDFLPDSERTACFDGFGDPIPGCTLPEAEGQDGGVDGPLLIVTGESGDLTFAVDGLGLEFLRQTNEGTRAELDAWCADQGDGWRLPSFFELLATVDVHASGTLWNSDVYFTDGEALANPLWTQTLRPGSDDDWMRIHLGDPATRIGYGPGDFGSAACVRSVRGPLELVFLDSDLATAYEVRTGLVFRRVAQDGLTWSEALEYCVELETSGSCTDWHLGSVKELAMLTLIEPGTPDDPAAVDVSDTFWTATPLFEQEPIPSAYAFYGNGGVIAPLAMAETASALCVCDPNSFP